MRLPVSLLALVVTVAGEVARQTRGVGNTDKNDAIQHYFGQLIPVVNDTILHKNAGPGIEADPGVVLTISPDPEHPGYSVYYVRDAALLHHAWLNRLIASSDGTEVLRALLDDSVRALIRTQHVENPSGNVFTGGLEEVAFDRRLGGIIDPALRSILGSPAADGPPSRAGVLIKYAEWLTDPGQNNGTWVADVLWPAIDLDLQWISLHWNQSSWDLWVPPVWGGSYWTVSLQYRALRSGAHLARKIGRGGSASSFEGRASVILEYLQTFWNEEKGFMSETTVTDVATGGRSGIGAVPLTVSVLNFDPSLGCDSATFQPCSERALSSLKFLIDAYRKHYPINKDIPNDQPVLLGGFLEDSFLGGGAQYFSTFNSAEQLLDAVLTWDLIGELHVTKKTLPFFQRFDRDIEVGAYRHGHKTYESLTDAITTWAENTLLLVSEHTPGDYILPLSINGTSGEPYGPLGALRSLVAALSARDAYNGLIPISWAHGSYISKDPQNSGADPEGRAHEDTYGSED